ncbi:MAG: alkaline phosphatase family protein [Terriglobia bacterium]
MAPIKHFFVLMLENRSYDNLFGYSGFQGVDPYSGNIVRAEDLSDKPQFSLPKLSGAAVPVQQGASYRLRPVGDGQGPGHEFTDTLLSLCGQGAFAANTIAADVKGDYYECNGSNYPALVPSANEFGYAIDYEYHGGTNPEDVLRCFSPGQVPVLNQLAKEFVVCDRWFSSMPGPTWPNRFFALCGSSGGLDHSPSDWKSIITSSGLEGFHFQYGSIFHRLPSNWLVVGSLFPQAMAISGLETYPDRFIGLNDLLGRLKEESLTEKFIWIEPDFDPFPDFGLGNSMHPHGDVRLAEKLVKKVYEAIRDSSYWKHSLLLVLFDEHGGFFDHVTPPGPLESLVPGDDPACPDYNVHGFRFNVLGPRVPAIVVSPWVKAGAIDQRQYDHTAIIKTASDLFGFDANMGNRVAKSCSLTDLLSLEAPRLTNDQAMEQLPKPRRGAAATWKVWWRWFLRFFKHKTLSKTSVPYAMAAARMHVAKHPECARDFQGKSEQEIHTYLKSKMGIYKRRKSH